MRAFAHGRLSVEKLIQIVIVLKLVENLAAKWEHAGKPTFSSNKVFVALVEDNVTRSSIRYTVQRILCKTEGGNPYETKFLCYKFR